MEHYKDRNKGTYGRIKQNKIFTMFFMTFFVIIFLVAKVQVHIKL